MAEQLNFQKKKVFIFMKIILFYLLTVVIIAATSKLTKNFTGITADLLSVILASSFTIFLIFLFIKWDKIKPADIGIIPNRLTLKRFFIGFGIGLSIAIAQAILVFSFGHLTLSFTSTFNIQAVILPLFLYFFVAIREELAFRTYVLRTLDYKFNTIIALSVMIILFIFEHIVAGVSWKMAIIGSGLGGLLFGLAALKTKGIALSIGLHTSWNFGQWLLGFKNQTGIWQATVDKGYELQTENIGLVAFILVMLTAIFIISSKKFNIN
ncbi:MAG: CPBP family intramembrane glutamic endopeptidase [Chryseobacterium sp.]|uniref:CPBP family intramembrane glutamic endopeptidase n=1 Tax=Chryseobacterium sp. TaxID=1871047 RepID=UPI003D0FBAAA